MYKGAKCKINVLKQNKTWKVFRSTNRSNDLCCLILSVLREIIHGKNLEVERYRMIDFIVKDMTLEPYILIL